MPANVIGSPASNCPVKETAPIKLTDRQPATAAVLHELFAIQRVKGGKTFAEVTAVVKKRRRTIINSATASRFWLLRLS
jgi:hypothetical protein